MLHAVLSAVQHRDGPVDIQTLSRELQIEPGALAGMLDFWVRKGRVRRIESGESQCARCTLFCGYNAGCPLPVQPPVTYTGKPEPSLR